MSCFRGLVEYAKNQDKDLQKVFMEPDESLQKINDVKIGMLRESILKAEREKWPEIKYKMKIEKPETLNVAHFEGFKENINDVLSRNYHKVPEASECKLNINLEMSRVEDLENLITASVAKLEIQERHDCEYFSSK